MRIATPSASSGSDRLLLIEDDTTQARMIEGMLRVAGSSFEITHIGTLAEAKEFLRQSRVACVLLDLTLPDASGLDGLIDLRGVSSEAPIVVVTADDDESRGIKAVQAGAQDYLIKGRMNGEQLRRSVRYAIERQRGEVQLAHRALHDELTGLPNRTLFLDRVELALSQSERHVLLVAVLFLDLDGFKSINDEHGHAAGDVVLQTVGTRLLAALRTGDTAARYGGDEFAILCGDVVGAGDATRLADRLVKSMLVPFKVGTTEIALSTSIGIVLGRGIGTSALTMVADADEAMYGAKQRPDVDYVLRPVGAPRHRR